MSHLICHMLLYFPHLSDAFSGQSGTDSQHCLSVLNQITVRFALAAECLQSKPWQVLFGTTHPWAQPIPFLDHRWQIELFSLSSGLSLACPSRVLGTSFSCPHQTVLPGLWAAGPQRPSRPFCSVVIHLRVVLFCVLNHEIAWNLG